MPYIRIKRPLSDFKYGQTIFQYKCEAMSCPVPHLCLWFSAEVSLLEKIWDYCILRFMKVYTKSITSFGVYSLPFSIWSALHCLYLSLGSTLACSAWADQPPTLSVMSRPDRHTWIFLPPGCLMSTAESSFSWFEDSLQDWRWVWRTTSRKGMKRQKSIHASTILMLAVVGSESEMLMSLHYG